MRNPFESAAAVALAALGTTIAGVHVARGSGWLIVALGVYFAVLGLVYLRLTQLED